MKRVPQRRGRKRTWALLAVIASGAARAPSLAATSAYRPSRIKTETVVFDASVGPSPPTDAAVDEGEAATTELEGLVLDPSGDAMPGALVAVEVGGLNLPNPGAVGPDGGVQPTLKIDPFFRLGARDRRRR